MVLGGAFASHLRKAGLGVGLKKLAKGTGIATLGGRCGGAANFAAGALVKAGFLGAIFGGGVAIGNGVNASIDTRVDNNESFLGVPPNKLRDLGFGSGIPNK